MVGGQSLNIHYSPHFTHEATETREVTWLTQNHTVSWVGEGVARPQAHGPKEPCCFLSNSLPAKTLPLSLCLFILTKSLGEKMETLSRHVGESKLPAGVLHSWSRPQPFSRTGNKKRKVPTTQCINQLHHPSQTEEHRMPGRGTKEKVPPGPWGCPQIWGRRLGARTPFLCSSPPLGYLHFIVVLDDLRSPVKALGCG